MPRNGRGLVWGQFSADDAYRAVRHAGPPDDSGSGNAFQQADPVRTAAYYCLFGGCYRGTVSIGAKDFLARPTVEDRRIASGYMAQAALAVCG